MTAISSSTSIPRLPAEVSIPRARATYRVQLHAGFTFDDAVELVPYLASLGISHLYCSPVLRAVAGSTHGYDIVDHSRLSDDLGGNAAYARLCDVLGAHEMSLVLDIVPNHMALAGAANRWWWDVLEVGPESPFAHYFDIDWTPASAGTAPWVLMPVLGDSYDRVLAAGELALARLGGSFTVRYHEHELPLSPRSARHLVRAAAVRAGSAELQAIADGLDAREPSAAERASVREQVEELAGSDEAVADAIDAELRAVQAAPDALDALLRQQSYRLAHWRTAGEELNYRRFFDITSLVGLRAEDEIVFEATHRRLLELVAAGDVTGLRVDHVDGLLDPEGYLRRLQDAAPRAFVAVEKILALDEELPPTWPVVGTSGYDFVDRVGEVFVDPAGEGPLTAAYEELVDDHRSFAAVAREAKHRIMQVELAAETRRLTDLLVRICQRRRGHRGHTGRDLRAVLQEVVASMEVYRTYVAPARATSAADRARVADTFADVAERRPDLDRELLALLERILVLDEPGDLEVELAVRFQQLSAPVMAKGVEDTAFYRYARLLSCNEVGGDPGTFGRGVQPFHRHNAAIAERWPATMLALSTHDTKRSADVRARISLLSELPDAWPAAVRTWMAHNDPHRRDGRPGPLAELVLYQTLVGAWPLGADRVEAAMVKSANEAKVYTSWASPDPAYEGALRGFVADVLADDAFVALLEAFLAEHDVVQRARVTSLAQVTLLLTSPGVPDVYQGDELWDLSLVDPDNRRPVDFEARAALLTRLADAGPEQALALTEVGGPKLWLLHRLLQHRRRDPARYEASDYVALEARGSMADHVLAFARDGLVAVVPRLVVGLQDGWQGTTLALPAGRWTDVLSGTHSLDGEVTLDRLLERFPVAVLERDGVVPPVDSVAILRTRTPDPSDA